MSSGLTSGFSDLLSSMGTFFDNLGSLMGTWFNNVVNAVGNVTSTLVTWFGNLIGSIVDGFNLMGTLLGYIWEFFVNLIQWFIDLIVPYDGYFSEKNNALLDNLNSKFEWTQVFGNMLIANADDSFTRGYSIPFLMGTSIDFSWYIPYRTYVKGIMAGCFSALIIIAMLLRVRVKFSVNG